jgi:hypothetical protein
MFSRKDVSIKDEIKQIGSTAAREKHYISGSVIPVWLKASGV